MEQRRCLGCMKLTDQPFCPHCGYPANATNEPHQLAAGSVLRDQYLIGRVLGLQLERYHFGYQVHLH